MDKLERYSRQMRVPGFDADAQSCLQQARVLIVGAGGLGAPVAAQLAGAGVGSLSIVDFDQVSLGNLHRQWLYTESDIDTPKVQALARHLCALNSNIEVIALEQRLAISNVHELIQNIDLVIDAADNFPASYLLSDACFANQVPLLTASVNQLFGYVGIFCAPNSPSFRAVFPRIPLNLTSCDVVGVTGPAVTTLAGFQAQAALDFLLNLDSKITGKLVYVDLRNFSLRTINCESSAEPLEPGVQLVNALEIGAGDWVIDVRELDEVNSSPQAFRVDQVMPLSSFNTDNIKTGKARVLFACQSGQRAMVAAQRSIDAGICNTAVALTSE